MRSDRFQHAAHSPASRSRAGGLAVRSAMAGIRLVSFNVLSPVLAPLHLAPGSEAHDWPRRRARVADHVARLEPDVVCLQEVEVADSLCAMASEALASASGSGVGWVAAPRANASRTDGCSLMWRADRLKLVDWCHIVLGLDVEPASGVQTRGNVALAAVFRIAGDRRSAPAHISVVTTHLLFNPRRSDVKLAQLWGAVAGGEALRRRCGLSASSAPMVVCGDFNSTPDSAVYEMCVSPAGLVELEGQLVGAGSGQAAATRRPPAAAARLGLRGRASFRFRPADAWARRPLQLWVLDALSAPRAEVRPAPTNTSRRGRGGRAKARPGPRESHEAEGPLRAAAAAGRAAGLPGPGLSTSASGRGAAMAAFASAVFRSKTLRRRISVLGGPELVRAAKVASLQPPLAPGASSTSSEWTKPSRAAAIGPGAARGEGSSAAAAPVAAATGSRSSEARHRGGSEPAAEGTGAAAGAGAGHGCVWGVSDGGTGRWPSDPGIAVTAGGAAIAGSLVGGSVALVGRTAFPLAPGALGDTVKILPPGQASRRSVGARWAAGVSLRLPLELGRGFVSAMDAGTGRGVPQEPAFTMFGNDNASRTCVDYVMLERGAPLRVTGRKLPPGPEELMRTGLPSPAHPSDHVALCLDLELGRWKRESPSGGHAPSARRARRR